MVMNFRLILKKYLNQKFFNIFRLLYTNIKYLDVVYSSLFFKKNNQSNNKILFATVLGGEISSIRLESTLAKYFQKKLNYRTDFLLCDGALEACQMFKYNSNKDDIYWLNKYHNQKLQICKICLNPAKKILNKIGNVFFVSDEKNINFDSNLLKKLSFGELKNYMYKNHPVGEQALAGALRYLSIGSLPETIPNRLLLEKYLISAIDYSISLENLIIKNRYSFIVCNHGVYVPHGITVSVARKYNIGISVWNLSYKFKTFMFSNGDTYHKTMIRKTNWDNFNFDENKKQKVINYLNSRISGRSDWLSFQKNNSKLKNIFKILNINKKNFSSSTTLVTNVLWDAQIHFSENIFKNMMEWIFTTIDFYLDRPKDLLFIRVHPAEKRGVLPSRELVFNRVIEKYASLPKNIYIFDSESDVSSYDCARHTDVTVIYGTKMGVELSSFGKPVIVVGDAWIRNKGITFEPKSINEYLNLLSNVKKLKMSEFQINLALKYAYWFFFINSIEVNYFKFRKKYPPFRLPLILKDNSYRFDQGLEKISSYIVSGI